MVVIEGEAGALVVWLPGELGPLGLLEEPGLEEPCVLDGELPPLAGELPPLRPLCAGDVGAPDLAGKGPLPLGLFPLPLPLLG